ncbi:hypothetical protein [Acuticoccus sediminis]|uniref:hypothetical protein n=1 Tax=Acuticoccus sediminis TaxID=2184697 RepID=UPI0011B944DF|nr:hypothetical protein [Acuticoccus sediminis]
MRRKRSRHLETLHRVVGGLSALIAIVGLIVIASLSGAFAAPHDGDARVDRNADGPSPAPFEVAQATFVRQDVIYPDRVFVADPRIAGGPCGAGCGGAVAGEIGTRKVKERYWYRARSITAPSAVSRPACASHECAVR